MFVQVKGFPDYLIDENGFVVSLKKGQWNLLTPGKDSGGYPFVRLYRDSKGHGRTVHRVMVETFMEPRPAGFTVNHKDGNKENNTLVNLELVSHADNIQHAIQTNLRNTAGENNPKAKLSDSQAAHLISLKGTMLQREAAELFGISQTQVSKLWTGRQRKSKGA